MKHELKTLPGYFQAIIEGRMTFNVRWNEDRGFQAGDIIVFNEFDPSRKNSPFTGRLYKGLITYVSNLKQQPGYVVFSFRPLPAPLPGEASQEDATIYASIAEHFHQSNGG